MKKIVSLAALVAILATACKKETVISEHNGEATLQFDALVGNADFTLNQNVTIGSRTYQFKNFRYWVSNLVFVKAGSGLSETGWWQNAETTGRRA